MRTSIILSLIGGLLTIPVSTVQGFGRGAAVGGARVGPGGGYQSGFAARGTATGPYGGVRAGNVQGRTYSNPRGGSVQHIQGSGVSRGPLGGVNAGRGSATRVTTPNGNTFTRTNSSGARIGPAGGVRVGGASSSTVRTPFGGASTAYRGGVAVGPAGGVRVGSTRTGVAVGPYGGVAGTARYGAVGHRTVYTSPVAVRSSATVVRAGRYPYFTPTWYQAHTTAWVAPRWVSGYNYWRPVAWGTLAPFVGIAGSPITYDYGSTTVINDNTVYQNGQPAGSADEYAAQATQIVDTGRAAPTADTSEFQPLGVFGLIQENETVAQRIFQLAIDKNGVLRGNYYDAVADSTQPIFGAVDKASQRIAWSIGDKKEIVFETGLQNLTEDQSTVLIHYGKEKTVQMILVRLPDPNSNPNGDSDGPGS